jgi:sulfate adenylyltransferase subunit 2
MHLLNNESGGGGLQPAALHEASSVPKIFGSQPLPPPSMDHLDELEAQSIYILREAFARLKKLALLW